MGGKPKTNTPADMRLSENKAKYGTVANRDAAKQQSKQQTKSMANQPSMKKGS